MTDQISEIATDISKKLATTGGEEVDWSKTYDVNIFGQKYTANASVKINRIKIPLLGSFKTGTTAKVVLLANTEEVTTVTVSYPVLPGQLRDTFARAHARRQARMDDWTPPGESY